MFLFVFLLASPEPPQPLKIDLQPRKLPFANYCALPLRDEALTLIVSEIRNFSDCKRGVKVPFSLPSHFHLKGMMDFFGGWGK